jgi:Holliday junction resolvasome RuvABC DNA-binding subunit
MASKNLSTYPKGADNDKLDEIVRVIESKEWDTLDRLIGMSPEEAERILREEPTIDAEEFKRLMEEADRKEEREHAAQGFDVGETCKKPA